MSQSTVAAPPLDRTATLMQELQDLKRLQPAHLPHSIATGLFRTSWRGILDGRDTDELALDMVLKAILSILFPGVEARFFRAARLTGSDALTVFRRALDRSAANRLPDRLYQRLEAHLPVVCKQLHDESHRAVQLPEPLDVLCNQPRAGATHPDLPRLVLEPAEMHSDHCALTAVYGVLMADHYGSDKYGTIMLAALAHHLHNAYLPDCGYAGEICLGEHLQHTIDNCRATALDHFEADLRERIQSALRHHESIRAAEGRSVIAGDVLDRVLDVKWRTRAAAVTDRDILGELDLVHPGPLKDFQTDLLSRTEVWKG